jgi:hypothetical protein
VPLVKRTALIGPVGPRQVLRVRGEESPPPPAPSLCLATPSATGEEREELGFPLVAHESDEGERALSFPSL